jgi:tetraprenyl-beta-curcumene synthase
MTTRECLGPRLGLAFSRAVVVYWLDVFPRVSSEIESWKRRACTIPDEGLRSAALKVQHTKRGNLEGAAAFAAFVASPYRPAVIRAQVGLQAIYDYVDTLAEQPSAEPIRNSYQLHQALRRALEPNALHADYYAHYQQAQDSEYLIGMIEMCRASLNTLPSHAVTAAPIHRFTTRIISYQTFNVPSDKYGNNPLARWAKNETPRNLTLRWWETAASAGSSLGIFVLLALAAEPRTSVADIQLIEHAYFPWIGALHSLLDSLVDFEEDAATGQPNLVANYTSADETASRMRIIATESVRQIARLPNASSHMLVLAGMVSFYLSAYEAHSPCACPVAECLRDALGFIAVPAMLVLRARRTMRNGYPARCDPPVVRPRTNPQPH